MPHCDCSESEVTESHIRERIARLERATRFRPVHIRVLFLDASPPAFAEEDFYSPAANRTARPLYSRMYFDELAVGSGISRDSVATLEESAALAEFQRHGFFLTHVVECPVDNSQALRHAVNRLAPTLLRRLEASYKPKYIVPVGQAVSEIIPFLQMSGWNDHLILAKGSSFEDPFLGDPQNQAEFGTYLGDSVARAIPAPR